MNRYLKEFLHRGLLFGGFGPVVLGVVYVCLSLGIDGFALSGWEVFMGIISTYILAFVQAGASVFNQIESWSVSKSLLCHLSTLYLAYVLCYLINDWIPFKPVVLVIFTAVFVAGYLVIWFSVLLSLRLVSKKINRKLL